MEARTKPKSFGSTNVISGTAASLNTLSSLYVCGGMYEEGLDLSLENLRPVGGRVNLWECLMR